MPHQSTQLSTSGETFKFQTNIKLLDKSYDPLRLCWGVSIMPATQEDLNAQVL